MTLHTVQTKAHYIGNGITRVWPLPYPVLDPAHAFLVVTDTVTGQETPITSGYKVTGCGTPQATVTYPLAGVPLSKGKHLTIFRHLPLTQETDLENGGKFNAEVIERQFDISTMQIQQLQAGGDDLQTQIDHTEEQIEELQEQSNGLQEQVDRAVKVPQGWSMSADELRDILMHSADNIEEIVAKVKSLAQEARDTITKDVIRVEDSTAMAHKWAANPENTPVQGNEYSAYHWAKKAQQALSSPGFTDYTIGLTDPSGSVCITLADIGHPAMPGPVNPIINIISQSSYTHTITSRSSLGFTVAIYGPDGTQGIKTCEYVDCGSFTCGDGTKTGDTGKALSFLAISIPTP